MSEWMGGLIVGAILTALGVGFGVLVRETAESISTNGARFSLRTLLIVMTAIALVLALASAIYTALD